VAKKKTSKKAGKKFVYFFGNGKADGNRNMKDTLGGKGAGLAEMTNAGLPVPAGFTISTDACNIYYANHSTLPANIETEMVAQLRKLEKAAGAEEKTEATAL
jgi:pyruvate,orthophosphate dikinase